MGYTVKLCQFRLPLKLMIRNIFYLTSLIFFGGAVSTQAAFAAYGDWHAKVIDVRGKAPVMYVEDYAYTSTGDSWDFNEEDMEGINLWRGISQISVEDGKLYFVTEKDCNLIMGDFNLDKPELGELSIASKWSAQAWPWVVQIKIRQSLGRSEWFAEAAYRGHGRRRTVLCKNTLNGTKEQLLQFEMGAAITKYFALRIGSSTPTNKISIDWIKVVRPSSLKKYCYSFNLTNTCKYSKLIFAANGQTNVYLNDKKIDTRGAKPPFNRKLNVYENIAAFHRGRNDLFVTVESYSAYSRVGNPGSQFFFMEGIIVDEQGKTVRIATDERWKGAFAQGENSNSWIAQNNAVVEGSVKKIWPELKGMKKYERFGDRPYLGRIECRYGDKELPIFSENEEILIRVSIIGGKKAPHSFQYSVEKWSDDKRDHMPDIVSGAGTTGSPISLGQLPSGVYEFVVTFNDTEIKRDEFRQEIVVAGRISQPKITDSGFTEGLTLKQVDSVTFQPGIDRKLLCSTREGEQDNWLDGSAGLKRFNILTNLLEGHFTKSYLELPPERTAWCSVKFKTGSLYKPHLIEIEYPQGNSRNMVFVVAENSRFHNPHNIGPGGGVVRLSSGVFTKDGVNPGGVLVNRYIYWPNRREASLTIVNAGRQLNDRGAISKLTVYEIENTLPWYKPVKNVCENLLIGPFIERIDRTTPRLFYSGPLETMFSRDRTDCYFPGYFHAWYVTINNLIQYLRFSGQNTYFAGIYMYYGGWFPSNRFEGHAESGVNNLAAGWNDSALKLMAEMFAENDLSLVLGIQFIGSRELLAADSVTDLEVHKGKESPRFIDKNGRQARGFQEQGFNFMIPQVRQEVLELVDEIGSRYASYKSIKGLSWMRLPEFPWNSRPKYKMSSPMDVGYGDTTIQMYSQDTLSQIPSWGDSVKRFEKRYHWLMKHEKDQWIQWRCKKNHAFDVEIKQKFKSYRNDWEVWRLIPRPLPNLIEEWDKGRITYLDVYKYGGIDPLLYNTNQSPKLMRLYDIGAEKKYEKGGYLRNLKKTITKFYQTPISVFTDSDIFLHIGFMIEPKLKTQRKWFWRHLNVVGYSVPAESKLYSVLPQGMKMNPRAVAIGWSDAGHFEGSEDDVREIVKLFSK